MHYFFPILLIVYNKRCVETCVIPSTKDVNKLLSLFKLHIEKQTQLNPVNLIIINWNIFILINDFHIKGQFPFISFKPDRMEWKLETCKKLFQNIVFLTNEHFCSFID